MKFLSVATLILLLFSCKKEKTSWNIDAATPVAYGNLTLINLVQSNILTQLSDSTLVLSFSDTLFNIQLDTLAKIPDTSIVKPFTIAPLNNVNATPGLAFANQIQDFVYDGIDIIMHKVILKEGQIDFELTSPLPEQVEFIYSIPSATLNGVPFTGSIFVPGAPAGQKSIKTGSFDLSGYELDLRGINGTEHNTLQTQISVRLDSNADPITVTNQDTLFANSSFFNFNVAYAEGYFGNQQFSESSAGEALNYIGDISGVLDIDQVDVNLNLINGVGAIGQLKINQLSSINTNSGNTVDLVHPLIGNSININPAAKTSNYFIPSSYPIQFNNGNSNIDAFIENLPNSLAYNINFELNPIGNITGSTDFLYDKSDILALIDFEMPLCLLANNLTLTDTLSLNLSKNANNINSVSAFIEINNGFPLSAEITLEIIDNNNNLANSLPSQEIIAANTDAFYNVNSKTNSLLEFTFSASDFETIKNNGKVVFKVKFNTPSTTDKIKIKSYHNLNYKLSTTFNYKVEF